ncbi:MAG: hypothetical protein BMS9Abin32_184 [Gammaproteobacteria bacterium]|nr:MAG: hypothetical protein BMS9Abin32_184 [Gammaproteobacteria bacterium]
MGLQLDRHCLRAVAASLVAGWWLPLAVAAGSLLAQSGGPAWQQALRFDRDGIAGGQFWRLLSGHFVHLGWPHAAMNIAGLMLLWLLLRKCFRSWQWCAVGLISMAAIDLGFWVLQPQLLWYVGLSGLLHGLLAAGALHGMRHATPGSWYLLVLLLAKLGYEQVAGPLPGSVTSAGGPVAVDAHLYGAVGGAVAALALQRSRGRAAPI